MKKIFMAIALCLVCATSFSIEIKECDENGNIKRKPEFRYDVVYGGMCPSNQLMRIYIDIYDIYNPLGYFLAMYSELDSLKKEYLYLGKTIDDVLISLQSIANLISQDNINKVYKLETNPVFRSPNSYGKVINDNKMLLGRFSTGTFLHMDDFTIRKNDIMLIIKKIKHKKK